jgi:hypothetical protein
LYFRDAGLVAFGRFPKPDNNPLPTTSILADMLKPFMTLAVRIANREIDCHLRDLLRELSGVSPLR